MTVSIKAGRFATGLTIGMKSSLIGRVSLVTMLLLAGLVTASVLSFWHSRRKAELLLKEASLVRAGDNMQALRARWENHFGKSLLNYGAHSFGVNLTNDALVHWRLATPALLAVSVHGTSGSVTSVSALYYSSFLNAPPGVILSKSIGGGTKAIQCKSRVVMDSDNRIQRAFINFPFQDQQFSFVELNASCMACFRGCGTPEMLFPNLEHILAVCPPSRIQFSK